MPYKDPEQRKRCARECSARHEAKRRTPGPIRDKWLKKKSEHRQMNRGQLNEEANLRRAADPEKFRLRVNKSAARPEAKKNRRRLDHLIKYGLNSEQFDAMIAAQSNSCAICGDQMIGLRNRHVDHCHTTSKVRGLLCLPCNLGLGYFKDNIERLRKAIDYLNTHQEVRLVI